MQLSPADIEKVDALLPQTQCTQCGYPRCYDYAEALLRDEADINQCPPGGDVTIELLAKSFAREAKALNPENGKHKPRTLAVIREAECIGCTLCIQACPVDAILGAGKLMHTVIESECTGCELCVPPCPVDCIDLSPANVKTDDDSVWPEYPPALVKLARNRTNARIQRLAKQDLQKPASRKAGKTSEETESLKRREDIRAALARVKRRRANESLAGIKISNNPSGGVS